MIRSRVVAILERAGETFHRLPKSFGGPAGFHSIWPEYVMDYPSQENRVIPPTAREISEYETVATVWLPWLSANAPGDVCKIVWLRSAGLSWHSLSLRKWKFTRRRRVYDRVTLKYWFDRGVDDLAEHFR